jgi:hypothetical protein
MCSMNYPIKFFLLLPVLLFPVHCFASEYINDVYVNTSLISIFNLIILITSVISIFQYFFRGMKDHTDFQVTNIILVIAFYLISLSFLICHRQYYSGFEHLSPLACIGKIFFTFNRYSIKHWIILFALFINFLYLIKSEEPPTSVFY